MKSNLNLRDNEENTALLLAIQKQGSEIEKILIAAGANVNIKNFRKKNAILYAIVRRDVTLP